MDKEWFTSFYQHGKKIQGIQSKAIAIYCRPSTIHSSGCSLQSDLFIDMENK